MIDPRDGTAFKENRERIPGVGMCEVERSVGSGGSGLGWK